MIRKYGTRVLLERHLWAIVFIPLGASNLLLGVSEEMAVDHIGFSF